MLPRGYVHEPVRPCVDAAARHHTSTRQTAPTWCSTSGGAAACGPRPPVSLVRRSPRRPPAAPPAAPRRAPPRWRGRRRTAAATGGRRADGDKARPRKAMGQTRRMATQRPSVTSFCLTRCCKACAFRPAQLIPLGSSRVPLSTLDAPRCLLSTPCTAPPYTPAVPRRPAPQPPPAAPGPVCAAARPPAAPPGPPPPGPRHRTAGSCRTPAAGTPGGVPYAEGHTFAG